MRCQIIRNARPGPRGLPSGCGALHRLGLLLSKYGWIRAAESKSGVRSAAVHLLCGGLVEASRAGQRGIRHCGRVPAPAAGHPDGCFASGLRRAIDVEAAGRFPPLRCRRPGRRRVARLAPTGVSCRHMGQPGIIAEYGTTEKFADQWLWTDQRAKLGKPGTATERWWPLIGLAPVASARRRPLSPTTHPSAPQGRRVPRSRSPARAQPAHGRQTPSLVRHATRSRIRSMPAGHQRHARVSARRIERGPTPAAAVRRRDSWAPSPPQSDLATFSPPVRQASPISAPSWSPMTARVRRYQRSAPTRNRKIAAAAREVLYIASRFPL